MASSLLKRGFSEDIIEAQRPSTAERRKTLSINSSFDEAVADLEEAERLEKGLETLDEDANNPPNLRCQPTDSEESRRPGAHTLYHGQRQHTMFRNLEKIPRLTVFDDDDSEDEAFEDSGSFDDELSAVSGITMGGVESLRSPPRKLGSSGNFTKVDFNASQINGQGSVAGGETFVDEKSIAEFASMYGSHVFPDPDIQGHPVQKEQGITSIQNSFPQLSDIRYRKTDVFPKWMLHSEDWKKMKGLIKQKELMAAFKEGSHLRTPVQLDLIRSWLINNWEMARHLGPKRCLALAKAVVYEEIKTGSEIIREGDRGYIFYIIIGGTVGIYKKGYGYITTLGKGRFFGERALTSNEFETRQATVVVSSEPSCQVLVLHKSAYDSIIKGYQENLRTEAYRVLKSVPLFSQWGRRMLERVCTLLERRQVPANTLIFKQGDAPDYIYFIVEGNIEILKEITVFSKNRWPNPNLPGGMEEVIKKKVNKFKILDIGPGKYFGEIAIVNNTSRAATCQTTEPTVLLALDKFEFLNLLHKGHAMANVYSQTQGYPNDEHILNLFSQLVVKKKEKKDIKKTRSKGYDSKVGGMLRNKKKAGSFRGTATLPTDYGGKSTALSKASLAASASAAPMKKGDMITNESRYDKILKEKKAILSKIEREEKLAGKERRFSDHTLHTLPAIASDKSPAQAPKKPRMLAVQKEHKKLLAKQRRISIQLQKRKNSVESGTKVKFMEHGMTGPTVSMRRMSNIMKNGREFLT